MGVYFRTGQNSGVGFPWWFYLLVVWPVQAAILIFALGVWLILASVRGVFWLWDEVRS
jgi:hypothetical protein